MLILNLSVLQEDNEETITTIRGLDIQAHTEIMNIIKSFDANKLKDGTFASGESSARKELMCVEYLTVKLGECRTL